MTLQETKEYTKWLARFLLIGYVLIAIINECYSISPIGRDDSDAKIAGSGLAIRTDYKTGCQFYESKSGALTPRMDGEFNQLGCK